MRIVFHGKKISYKHKPIVKRIIILQFAAMPCGILSANFKIKHYYYGLFVFFIGF